MSLGEKPKRACIYFIYEKNGIIDDYILNQLKELQKNLSFLHCVINGKLSPEGRRKLDAIADELYVRENKGFDIGAYRAAIDYIGWDVLCQYDELVLMNHTCFGPVYPFSECFDWAAAQDIDFWGLTMGISEPHNFPEEYAQCSFAKEHIQSYFLVIRKPLLCSRDLREFMESRPEALSYSDSGRYFENLFTPYFRNRGFTYACYCDCTEMLELHNYPAMMFPLELIKKHRCPLFKKRLFTESYADLITQCVGQSALEVLEYLDSSGTYNTRLIWDNLIRTQDLSVLVRNCHLLRILPRDFCVPAPEESSSIGVVFHAYYPDLFSQTAEYLSYFPQTADLLITTDSEEKRNLFIQKFVPYREYFEVRVIENRGRDMSALLVGAADFVEKHEIVCFAHDKKTSQQKPGSVGASWAYELSENMFATEKYIKNVICLFEREDRLGILFPPYPTHNDYSGLATGWVGNYACTKKLMEELGIDVETHPQTLCVAPLGTNFWFRTAAMKKVFAKEWRYSDFPSEPIKTDGTILHAAERTFAYAAQSEGYYPAFLMNDIYARIEFTNLEIQKLGSQQMAAWLHASLLAGIYNIPAEQILKKNEERYQLGPIDYGIKGSLKHLSIAICNKYPRFWSVMRPFRWAAKKLMRV